ncbi:response regulator [bacterium SCSIO 12741]|nr:response regulator [bacterium SCSIO 12741]
MKKMASPLVFVVEDDPLYGAFIKEVLLQNEYTNLKLFQSGKEFMEELHKNPSIVILDYRLKEPGLDGLKILKRIKAYDPDIHVLMLTGQQKLEVAVNTLKYGAFDYVIKDENAQRNLQKQLQRIEEINNQIKNKKSSGGFGRQLLNSLLLSF